jgi:long-chain fatty acid transport protein
MFWNPATMTQMPGIQTEIVATGIFPFASNSPSAGSTLGVLGGTHDTGDDALAPSGYFSWQINPSLWVGLSMNSPFGLSVSFPDNWAGRDYGQNSSLKTYNATPSLAYRINDWLSIGAGVQIEYASASLMRGISGPFPGIGFAPLDSATLSGKGWGYGFTVGATFTPTPTTTIGLGYRSAIDQKIEGTLAVTGIATLPATSNGSASTTVNLPDVVSLGLRQRLDPQWTLLGTVEWTNWSRIGTSDVQSPNGSATIAGRPVALPFEFKDGWFFSLGAEYQWSDRLALRAGVGYELSPVTDDVRMPILPDNDRFWLSIGSSYHISNNVVLDLAYSHLFVRSTSIDISATSGNPWFSGTTYIGDVDAHVDIISAALKWRWDPEPPPVKKVLYTK